MSDSEMVSATTPGAGKPVKFANPHQVGAMFPVLQSRCSIQKGLLTKALNLVKTSKDEFCQAIEDNGTGFRQFLTYASVYLYFTLFLIISVSNSIIFIYFYVRNFIFIFLFIFYIRHKK